MVQNAEAQPLRQFLVCDSTEYASSPDTVIVAGRYKLYLKTDTGLVLIHDFSTNNANNYIRDFDVIRPDLWYALIGSRYIGDLTTLYKSNDQGITWAVDTNYFTAIDSSILQTNIGFDPFNPQYYNSINQVQKIGTDTILLFLGYYSSGIVYSINGGDNWKHWFSNTPAYYFGIFDCNSYYYLYQMPGDGFAGRMFSFEKQYLFRNDSLVNFDHLPSGSGHHTPFHITNDPNTLYFGSISNCETYYFLENHVDSLCNFLSSTYPLYENFDLKVYPNPNEGIFTIEFNNLSSSLVKVSLFNYLGQIVFENSFSNIRDSLKYEIDAKLNKGIHYLVVKSQNKIFTKKVLIY